jgi:hypothetical protein
MRIPIGENEIGAIYEYGKTLAGFYSLYSAYYNNCMIKDKPNAIICTYSEFKKIYPIPMHNNYRCVK